MKTGGNSSKARKATARMSRDVGQESILSNDRWIVAGIAVFLGAIVWLVFGQTLQFDFVNYDDNYKVYDNSHVNKGLTVEGIKWAFTKCGVLDTYWDPVSAISHMLDFQMWGTNPGGHHFTNVVIHTANVILLFLVLRWITGALWRSAFVAAIFAIHPLRVESVAWVTERRDVLSGLFFILALAAYNYYALNAQSKRRYLLVVVCFVFGMMAKPMVVTLPAVLLLLDYWPLRRVQLVTDPGTVTGEPLLPRMSMRPAKLVAEKIPLFILSAIFCLITLAVQVPNEMVKSVEKVAVSLRLENAAVSLLTYLKQIFLPFNLAVLYPYPRSSYPLWVLMISGLSLIAISTGAVVWRRKFRWFAVGWLWYLVMLMPVIGLVQSGEQAHADRFTYLPEIGIYIIIAWAAAEVVGERRQLRIASAMVGVTILVAAMACSFHQCSYWRDSKSLWLHALACTRDNHVAEYNFGTTLVKEGQLDAAIAHYEKAVEIKPDYAQAHNNFGIALARTGQIDAAIAHFQKALEIRPDYADACYDLGLAYESRRQTDQAAEQYEKAVSLDPLRADAQNNLGNIFLGKRQWESAIGHYQKALQARPDFPLAHVNMGNALAHMGKLDDAIGHYQKALELKPDLAPAREFLDDALAQKQKLDGGK